MSSDDFEMPEHDGTIMAEDTDPVQDTKAKKGSKEDWVSPGSKKTEEPEEAREDAGETAASEAVVDDDDPTLRQQPEQPKQPEFSKEELAEVFDALMFNGEYTEEFVFRDRMTFTFRSRTAQETASISRRIDGFGFTMMPTIQQHYGLLNLSYSLTEYNDKSLRNMKAIPERYNFICKLPSSVIDHLVAKLNTFDYKVFKACEEGAENF